MVHLIRLSINVLKITMAVLVLALLSGGSPGWAEPLPLVILDTDLSSDVDDVGAVAVLHNLADQGNVKILAMMISSGDPWSAPCLDSLNTWYGRPDIPIGMVKGKSVRHESKYTSVIAAEYPHDLASGDRASDAVTLYRKLLSEQADGSVLIVTIGYLTNLKNLLLSKPDAISPMNGLELVLKKVNRLVCMGGQYPKGREWNFYQDAPAAKVVLETWPVPAVFSGFEIGRSVMTGSGLRSLPVAHPVRRSYELYNGITDRPSWDQLTVYYAVLSASGPLNGFFEKKPGKNMINEAGENFWSNDGGGPPRQPDQSYLILRTGSNEIARILEQLMLASPR